MTHPPILTNHGRIPADVIRDVYVDIGHRRDGSQFHAVTLRCTPGMYDTDPVHATYTDPDKAIQIRDELDASLRAARRTSRGMA